MSWQNIKKLCTFHEQDLQSCLDICSFLLNFKPASEMRPVLANLATVALTLPGSTFAVEHGFSKQSLIQTKHRRNLKPDTLDALMTLAAEGPPRIF